MGPGDAWFRRAEIRRAGIIALAAIVFAGLAASGTAQQIAITFDDLPAHGPLPPGETRIEVANKVIHALKRAHVPPTYGFINAIRLQDDPSEVRHQAIIAHQTPRPNVAVQ